MCRNVALSPSSLLSFLPLSFCVPCLLACWPACLLLLCLLAFSLQCGAVIASALMQDVGEALEMEPSMLNSILGKALAAQRAAEAAKKARELVRRKSVLTKSTLPGKLADCQSTDKAESEVFLVEGDSAGATPPDSLPCYCPPCDCSPSFHKSTRALCELLETDVKPGVSCANLLGW